MFSAVKLWIRYVITRTMLWWFSSFIFEKYFWKRDNYWGVTITFYYFIQLGLKCESIKLIFNLHNWKLIIMFKVKLKRKQKLRSKTIHKQLTKTATCWETVEWQIPLFKCDKCPNMHLMHVRKSFLPLQKILNL